MPFFQPFLEFLIQPFVLRAVGLAGAPGFAALSGLAQPFPELLVEPLFLLRGIGLAGAPGFGFLFGRRL